MVGYKGGPAGGLTVKLLIPEWRVNNLITFNEPNPWGLSMPALQYNVSPHLPKVNKDQARMQNSSHLTVRVGG